MFELNGLNGSGEFLVSQGSLPDLFSSYRIVRVSPNDPAKIIVRRSQMFFRSSKATGIWR